MSVILCGHLLIAEELQLLFLPDQRGKVRLEGCATLWFSQALFLVYSTVKTFETSV